LNTIDKSALAEDIDLTILMPCLNEEKTIGNCIQQAQLFLDDFNVNGEILIADNGSTDRSVEISNNLGARVISVEEKGYGNALRGGLAAAQGKYIIMGDADESYDFYSLMPFVTKLHEGYDLVMGNRFKGGIKPGAMPPLHRYIGNPILSGIGKLFFRIKINDFHCGLRGFSRQAALKMDLRSSGMEFASEMVIKAALLKMQICEIPTTLSPDGRDRPPHLRSFRDGWRHLRFMLIFNPKWLFFYPGIALILIGVGLSGWTFFSPIVINSVEFDIHSLLYFNAMILIGFNLLLFSIQSRYYGYRSGLLPKSSRTDKLSKYFRLERGLLIGIILLILGVALAFWAFSIWAQSQFGDINPRQTMRIAIPSVTIIIIATQIIFSSFFVSILGIETNKLDRQ
jgi:glycosyltransferase involved in cell wall biosynthesis